MMADVDVSLQDRDESVAANPRVEVLLSSMRRTDPHAIAKGMGLPDDVDLLVINQCPDGELPTDVDDGRIRMRSYRERGLARSRNRGLDAARGDLLVLADDDCRLEPDLGGVVRSAFERHRRCAMISFRYADEGGCVHKRYPRRPRRHGRFSLLRVASVEIALDRRNLGGVRFDERFGLGTAVPLGAENVFLSRVLRSGLPMRFEPRTICRHRGMPTGVGRPARLETARRLGVVLGTMYPLAWPIAALASTIGQGGRGEFSRWSWLRELVRGARRRRRILESQHGA